MAWKNTDKMTPEWSRQLALVADAPMWRSLSGMKRKIVFMEEAATYPDYDSLPPRLKSVYDRASRQVPGSKRQRGNVG